MAQMHKSFHLVQSLNISRIAESCLQIYKRIIVCGPGESGELKLFYSQSGKLASQIDYYGWSDMNTPLPGMESGLKVVLYCVCILPPPQVGSNIHQSRITTLSANLHS